MYDKTTLPQLKKIDNYIKLDFSHIFISLTLSDFITQAASQIFKCAYYVPSEGNTIERLL